MRGGRKYPPMLDVDLLDVRAALISLRESSNENADPLHVVRRTAGRVRSSVPTRSEEVSPAQRWLA